jgi:hypothetical protein
MRKYIPGDFDLKTSVDQLFLRPMSWLRPSAARRPLFAGTIALAAASCGFLGDQPSVDIIAKIQRQSLLQNKLLAHLAEMSYQAVNGTRQAPRNFREGTLEIGKMHFTTPQDRITKEMIMDYQKTEQEKRTTKTDPITGKQLLYEPTGLGDVRAPFVPIDYGPLGAPATEEDVRNYEADYIQLFNDLNALTTDAKTKDEEVSDKQAEIFKKGEDVQNKKNEHTEAQKHWFELNTELIDVKKKRSLRML